MWFPVCSFSVHSLCVSGFAVSGAFSVHSLWISGFSISPFLSFQILGFPDLREKTAGWDLAHIRLGASQPALDHELCT